MMKSSKAPATKSTSTKKTFRELPALFYYMEIGDWTKALERIRRHPREAKAWATLRTKSTTEQPSTKRLALHHACFKLRSAGSSPFNASNPNEDEYIVVVRFILQLLRLYPDAAGQRESRHGCLPLHLAAFASCAPRREVKGEPTWESLSMISSTASTLSQTTMTSLSSSKPSLIARRIASDATAETNTTAMTAMHAEETFQGAVSDARTAGACDIAVNPRVSVSSTATDKIPPKREEVAVQLINALLDAFPKAIRVDSEGGRLVLHTACAGRATPRVVSTLITAYPSACRHRNKDGYLPLHLAAHWGVSHPSVAILLLKSYPDATLGRNRWERTPLEEALCMAGENGRPHQAALVRALRKHPSFWTRPPPEMLKERAVSAKARPIDMDESLPSNDSTLEAEEEQRRYGHEAVILELLDENDEIESRQSKDSSREPSGRATPPSPCAPLSPGRSFLGRLSPSRKRSEEVANMDLGTPLATLIHNRKWSKVISRLSANPLEAETELTVVTRGGFTASRGMTALHYACERKPPVEVVHCLIESYPHAVSVRAMPGGALPLHIACTWGASEDVVTALLSADAGTARMTDELGNIALHSATFSGADEEVVATLLDVDEKTVTVRNYQGSRPIDIVRRLRNKNRNEVIDLLVGKRDHDASGTWSASEPAQEVNPEFVRDGGRGLEIGYRAGDSVQDDHGGVEVTYEETEEDGEDLVWI
ncbi:hypothetical protein MPSEU_000212200 [Mayamaea pseudoterrestris]|nr:hypothetical protein MPSEU_000212200 [Mayamaea pseudoterrestris]